jgi:proline iminopeptidase
LSARRLLLHAAWLEDGALLRDVDKLTGIPGVLIHGRLDLSTPLDIPWMLGGIVGRQ